MKKILFALVVAITTTFISTHSYANASCEKIKDYDKYGACYDKIMDEAEDKLQHSYDIAMRSPKLTRKDKDMIELETQSMIERMDVICSTSPCIYKTLIEHSKGIDSFVNGKNRK